MSTPNLVSKEMLEKAIEQSGMLEDDYIGIRNMVDLKELDRLNIADAILNSITIAQLQDIADEIEVDAKYLLEGRNIENLKKVCMIIGYEVSWWLPMLTDEFNGSYKIGE